MKYSLGKLDLQGIAPEDLLTSATEAGYELLDVSAEDLANSCKLPAVRDHKDPFDRLLVWQCIRNDIILITADKRIGQYAKHGLRPVKQRSRG